MGPLQELAGARPAVPGAAFGSVGLQFEQITVERPLETGQGGLGAVGCVPQRRVARTRGGGPGVAAPPALEQPAVGERRRLARPELSHEPSGRGPLRSMVLEDVGPAWLSGSNG